MKWMWKPKIYTGIGFSGKAVWSRAARRHVTKSQAAAMEDDSDEEEMAIGFKVQVEANAGGVGGSKITIRWLKGHDSVLFESFCGMLKRKIEEEVQ
jgi:23S rRNA (adenine1618-N6)-methyltransferase